tara:strand:- start:77792 stop:78646 length:855 start_codon:yes stop_codon:yes gene_type:complete
MKSILKGLPKLAAEQLNEYPVRYSKSKVAGSNLINYSLHARGVCMPGQPNLFIANSKSKPLNNYSKNSFLIEKAFQLEKLKNSKLAIGIKYADNYLSSYTYEEFQPNDDDALNIAINAAYKQIFGNLHPMESEKPIDIERRLRNGDITLKEFIRQLAKSPFYRKHYLEKVSQLRALELAFKHILGRGPIDQKEVINCIEVINNEGFYYLIDYLIDSQEYYEIFGDHTVPYTQTFDSSCGLRTSAFSNYIILNKSFASSDNSIYRPNNDQLFSNGKSLLIERMAE